MDLGAVAAALADVRLHAVASEQVIHERIGEALRAAGIGFRHEVRLGPRNRVDFLCAGGIAVEVKRGKPTAHRVAAQVERYAAFPQVCGVVLVLERNLVSTPRTANGKPVIVVSLAGNWGIVT